MNPATIRNDRPLRRLDASVILLVGLLSLASVAASVDTGFPGVSDARAVDIAINVSATLVGAAVAILAWIRWRETTEPVALYESAAFVALTVINALMIGIVLTGQERAFGLSAADPGEAPIYLWTITRFAAAFLLVVGARRSLHRQAPPLPPIVNALAPAVTLVLVGLMLFGRETTLPPVPSADFLTLGGPGPLGLGPLATVVGLIQVLIFAAFIFAAVLFRRLYVRDGLVSHAFLAAGLVVAAFSQLHFALDPVVASGVVTTTDILRLGFYAILFMGIQAELESDLGALRRANTELRRLSEVDAANAALAERTRLAREIHDGLAQDLWYAKLKQGRLAQEPSLEPDARTTAREVLAAIDSALVEARQAVMTMRADPMPTSTREEVLHSYVDDFADRFGVRAEFTTSGQLPRLAPRTEAEVLRIVQEALTNVRRHADATVVRVATEGQSDAAVVSIADNGRGFDPDDVPADRFGLKGMRERAELIGAALAIDARPADGTRVTLRIPKAETAR